MIISLRDWLPPSHYIFPSVLLRESSPCIIWLSGYYDIGLLRYMVRSEIRDEFIVMNSSDLTLSAFVISAWLRIRG